MSLSMWTIRGLMHTSIFAKVRLMPRKYDAETRAKAIRLVFDHRADRSALTAVRILLDPHDVGACMSV